MKRKPEEFLSGREKKREKMRKKVRRAGLRLAGVFILPAVFSATALLYAEPISDILSAVLSGAAYILLFPRLMHRREAEDG